MNSARNKDMVKILNILLIISAVLFLTVPILVGAVADCPSGQQLSAGICVPQGSTPTPYDPGYFEPAPIPGSDFYTECETGQLDSTGKCVKIGTLKTPYDKPGSEYDCKSGEVLSAGICVPSDSVPSGSFPGKTTTGAKVGGVIPSGGSSGSGLVKIPNPLGVNTFADLIAKINKWLLIISVPIFTLMIFIGAFQLMIFGSMPEKVKLGRQTITWAVIGYALLLLSTGITEIIKNVLGAK